MQLEKAFENLKSLGNINLSELADNELAKLFFESAAFQERVLRERKNRRIRTVTKVIEEIPSGFEPFRTAEENALKVFCDSYYDCSIRKLPATLEYLYQMYLDAGLKITLKTYMDCVIRPLEPKIITLQSNGVYEFNNNAHRKLALRIE